MKHSLFWRMFSAFLAVLVLTIVVLSSTMIVMMRSERREALENEVRVQARDLAQLMQVRDVASFWRFDPSASASASAVHKIQEICELYDAEVWLVNINGNAVVMNGDSSASEQINDVNVIDQITRVLNGEEIRVTNLADGFDNTVTIGVPWYSGTPSAVMGAILLNVSTASLALGYTDLIRYSLLAGFVALALGGLLTFVIARTQSRPIQGMTEAVNAFAKGDFASRVEVGGTRETIQLGESFNSMAEELSRLDQSRKSFVANVSHELRSPMTCIQGYIQGMLDGTIQEDEREKYLKTVLAETQRLTRLIAELLDLSRFDSGKIPLNKTKFDINELILSVMFKFEKRIDDKGIDVEISFKDQPCYVEADSARLTQVITNLVDNAVKFAAENGHLVIWTHTVDNLCYVTIKNDGASIPQEDIPFIFERFYKVDKAHTSGGGTGLGLAIVHRIIEQHGQTISVSSAGGMTGFVFTLDRVKDPKQPSQTDGDEQERGAL